MKSSRILLLVCALSICGIKLLYAGDDPNGTKLIPVTLKLVPSAVGKQEADVQIYNQTNSPLTIDVLAFLRSNFYTKDAPSKQGNGLLQQRGSFLIRGTDDISLEMILKDKQRAITIVPHGFVQVHIGPEVFSTLKAITLLEGEKEIKISVNHLILSTDGQNPSKEAFESTAFSNYAKFDFVK